MRNRLTYLVGLRHSMYLPEKGYEMDSIESKVDALLGTPVVIENDNTNRDNAGKHGQHSGNDSLNSMSDEEYKSRYGHARGEHHSDDKPKEKWGKTKTRNFHAKRAMHHSQMANRSSKDHDSAYHASMYNYHSQKARK